MKYILILLLSVNIVLGGFTRCRWDKFDAVYNNVLYLNSSINIICNNFEFINNNSIINNITKYCRTHPTNNIMESLPKNNINRNTYCDLDDLRNIRNINNVLFEDYLSPICLMCNNIFNNIHKFNFSDQSYINNSVSICNSIDGPKKTLPTYVIAIIITIVSIMILIPPSLALYIVFCPKKKCLQMLKK
jgi:hypothetical protein